LLVAGSAPECLTANVAVVVELFVVVHDLVYP
jgi:hypothetical protein